MTDLTASVVAERVVLQVWHKNPDGSDGICGYLGKFDRSSKRWPLVPTTEQAEAHIAGDLAEGVTTQYFKHLKEIGKECRLPGMSVKYVPVEE